MSATKSEKCRRHYRAAALVPLTLKRLRTSHRTKARTDAELSATDCYVDRAELSAQGRKREFTLGMSSRSGGLIWLAAVLTVWSMVYYLRKAVPEIRAKVR